MAMKGYSALPKIKAVLELYHQIINHIQDPCGARGVLLLSRNAVYSIVSADNGFLFISQTIDQTIPSSSYYLYCYQKFHRILLPFIEGIQIFQLVWYLSIMEGLLDFPLLLVNLAEVTDIDTVNCRLSTFSAWKKHKKN